MVGENQIYSVPITSYSEAIAIAKSRSGDDCLIWQPRRPAWRYPRKRAVGANQTPTEVPSMYYGLASPAEARSLFHNLTKARIRIEPVLLVRDPATAVPL